VSEWPSTKARIVYKALLKNGSHKKLTHPNYGNYTWAFHDNEEIGPAMLARIAKRTGLRPVDL
jgi:predicted RNA binding protein YcfA (HicA-like mRNA interferase family)